MDKETIMQLLADGVISNKVAERYFPELKESEGEKIRKEILDYIDRSTGCKRWGAWLEKQGEQKPTDKVEPNPVWSEDDEIRHKTTLDDLEGFLEYIKQKPSREISEYSLMSKDSILIAIQKDIDWFRTLKERMQPQNTWKPSEHELEVLKLVAKKDGTCLMGLYEQLKKLKEE